jgi:hypothetical protein
VTGITHTKQTSGTVNTKHCYRGIIHPKLTSGTVNAKPCDGYNTHKIDKWNSQY